LYLLISAPIYLPQSLTPPACLPVCLSVCPSVYYAAPSNRFFFFLFLDGIEPFFGRYLSMRHPTKRFSSIFDLGPLTPKIYSQNWQLHKIAYKSACMTDRPEMFGPTRGFRGWPIQWNHAKSCGLTFVAMATTFGLGAEI